MEEEQNIQQVKPVRPRLLSVLCIITFIGSGISAFSFMIISVSYEQMMGLLRVAYAGMPEFEFILNAPQEFFLISFLLSAFSVLGAIFMWNLRRVGFHIYTPAQILTLALPLIYFSNEANPILNIMVTGLFVYLYSRNLKFMH